MISNLEVHPFDVMVKVCLGDDLDVAVGALDVLDALVDAVGVVSQPGVGRGDVRALLAFVRHLSRILKSQFKTDKFKTKTECLFMFEDLFTCTFG